jgi:hypothetical protein
MSFGAGARVYGQVEAMFAQINNFGFVGKENVTPGFSLKGIPQRVRPGPVEVVVAGEHDDCLSLKAVQSMARILNQLTSDILAVKKVPRYHQEVTLLLITEINDLFEALEPPISQSFLDRLGIASGKPQSEVKVSSV